MHYVNIKIASASEQGAVKAFLLPDFSSHVATILG